VDLAKEYTGRISLHFAEDVPKVRQIPEALVGMPPEVPISPLERPPSDRGAINTFGKGMLGMPSGIPEVRPSLDEHY
jgi:hypothetical protein